MAGKRISDKKRKKIIADYLMLGSYNAAGKANGVDGKTVKRIVLADPEMADKSERKKEENTADIIAYMESQRGLVCEIIYKGLMALNDPEKLKNANPAQITTALGTLIDKFTAFTSGGADEIREDELSRSLRELSKELESE